MVRRALVEILGNASGFKHATRESVQAANQLGHGLKKLSVDANASARAQVAASERKTSRLRHEVAAYKQIASAAKRGSHEQVAAAQLASKAELRLSRSLGVTATEQRRLASSAAHAEHQLSRGARGALAGSGAFKSMGRSLAFASGAFIGVAGVSSFLHSSIEAGVEAAAIQKQLAAQFKASGMALGPYQHQIDETTARLSSLSGFTRDDLVRSFTTAFRGSKDVTASLKLESVAADAARGAHKELSTVTLALTKAYLGNTGGLRRLGIMVPKTAKGMEVLNIVGRKFAGQALAGTTAQQRFSAELHNSQVIVGTALLPALTRLLSHGARWLSQMNRTGRLQRDVNHVVRTSGQVLRGLAQAFRVVRATLSPFVHLLGGARHAAMLAGLAFVGLKARTFALENHLIGASSKAGLLRGRLLSLKNLGPIAMVVALSFVPKSKEGQKVLNKTGLGFLGKVPILGDVVTQEAKYENKVARFFGRGVDTSTPKDMRSHAPKGYDPNTHGMAPSTADNPGGYLKKGKAPAGFEPGTYGMAPSTKDNPGGYLPKKRTGSKTAPATAAAAGPLGFKARLAKLEFQQSQAELTKTTADDKKNLQQQASAIRKRIATGKGTLAERTELNSQLKGVNDQIHSIDQDTVSKEKAAHDKKLALKKKQVDHEKAHQKKMQAEWKAESQRDSTHIQKLRDRLKADTAKMTAAIDTARGQFGELGQGSILNPSEEQHKRALGVPGHTIGQFTADLHAQNVDFKARQRDIKNLRRRHAPSRLLNELIAQGDAGAEELHTLAGAKGPAFHQFLAQYKQREKAIRQAARDSAPKVFVNVTLDGDKIAKAVKVRLAKTARHNAAQRGGRHSGVTSGIGP